MAEPSAYDRGRAAGEEALRAALLDVARELLVREGPEGLRMRRLAAAAGCSTTVLYRLFQGKEGVVAALYRDGFDRLRERLLAVVATADPRERLAALGHAYRASALADPPAYAVMFSRPVPEFTPSADDARHGRESLAVLADAVADAQAAGVLGGEDAWQVARVLWAAAHGAVSLELSAHLVGEEAAQTFTEVTAAAAARYGR